MLTEAGFAIYTLTLEVPEAVQRRADRLLHDLSAGSTSAAKDFLMHDNLFVIIKRTHVRWYGFIDLQRGRGEAVVRCVKGSNVRRGWRAGVRARTKVVRRHDGAESSIKTLVLPMIRHAWVAWTLPWSDMQGEIMVNLN
jgi:hypothetical protein